MKILLDVPYISQYSIGRDSDGRSRACGAACVKMILDYKGISDTDFLTIVREGQTIKGAYISGIGWTHSGLAELLRNHDVGSYAEEFRSIEVDVEHQTFEPSQFEDKHVERGIQKIAREVKNERPVIISGIVGWKEVDKPHLMIAVGVEKEGDEIRGFYYNDPDDENEPGKDKFINVETFRKYWRKFAIFID